MPRGPRNKCQDHSPSPAAQQRPVPAEYLKYVDTIPIREQTARPACACMHASNKPASSCKLCVSKSRDRQCRRPCFIGPAFFYRPRLTSPGYGGFRGPHGRPHASGEHHEHSGRPQPALQHVLPILSGLRKPAKRACIISISGVRCRGCVAVLQASICTRYHTFTCKL